MNGLTSLARTTSISPPVLKYITRQQILHSQLTHERLPQDIAELPIMRNGAPAHPLFAHAQRVEFALERESVVRHLRQAQAIVQCLPKKSKILVLDLSAGSYCLPERQNAAAVDALLKWQFGGSEDIRLSRGFGAMLGLDENDSRLHVWDVQREPSLEKMPNLMSVDAFMVTGGRAMPSEIYDRESPNQAWLKTAVEGLRTLERYQIPGLAICLGHQLWCADRGALVGTTKNRKEAQREFGTVSLNAMTLVRSLKLFAGINPHVFGGMNVASSHSESVLTMPHRGAQILYYNDYSSLQGFAFPPVSKTVAEANEHDQLVVTMQHHPEALAFFLNILLGQREEAMQKEGIDTSSMLFRNTPAARQIFINFLEMVGRRAQKRLYSV